MSESNSISSTTCYKCGDPINSSVKFKIHGNEYCSACFNDETINSDTNISTSTTLAFNDIYKNKYSKYLGIIAMIELISSIIASFYIWVEYGMTEIPNSVLSYYYSEKVINPIGIGLGFGVLFQGIVFFILLSALEIMSEDIARLRFKLDK